MSERIETRGRKSLPLDKKKAPQATVKINDLILPFVKVLKGNLKKGMVTDQILSNLFSTLNGTEQQENIFNDPNTVSIVTELQEKIHSLEAEKRISESKLVKQQEISLNLVQERDKEHFKAVRAESKLESLKSSYRLLKNTHDELLHREYDCMAITGSGLRCSKPAKLDVNQNGIMIRFCLRHKNLAKSNKKPS